MYFLTKQKKKSDLSKNIKKEENMSLNIQPLQDRIIIERLKEEEKTSGGIIIPDNAQEKPQKGKVVSTGKGRVGEDGKCQSLEVKKGDMVLFGKYAGTEFKVDEKDYLVMREEDIYGIIQ